MLKFYFGHVYFRLKKLIHYNNNRKNNNMGKLTGHEAPPQIHPVSCIQMKERTAGLSQYPGYKSGVPLQTPQCLTERTHIG